MLFSYTLSFTSPLHIGIESIGQEKIEHLVRSDTLWGAVISKWLLLFDDSPPVLCESPPFAVSSCFPLIQGTRFYPAPIGCLDDLINQVAKEPAGSEITVKVLKKIKFLSEDLFISVCKGHKLKLDDLSSINVFPFEVSNQTNCNHIQFAKEAQRPRIRINQLCGGVIGDAFFYCSDQYWPKASGQHFLARFKDKEAKSKFESALMLLGESGLGADSSVGRGVFTFHAEEINMEQQVKNATQAYVLLSLCLPHKDEVKEGLLSDKVTKYSLVRRFGMAGCVGVNRFRRPDCWMLSEGSVFQMNPEGSIVKVISQSKDTPHDVYRYGKAFSLPLAI